MAPPPPASFDAAAAGTTLFGALLGASRRFGGSKLILEDSDRAPVTYGRLIWASLLVLASMLGSAIISSLIRVKRHPDEPAVRDLDDNAPAA